ncbi:MAG: hypothetical protein Q8Q09_05040 [Deltaproteobacteria bacterium]|nr:hypothetical protein [Deltaproteobacteria bacterium]
MKTRLFATIVASSALVLGGCAASVHMEPDASETEDSARPEDAVAVAQDSSTRDAGGVDATSPDVTTPDATAPTPDVVARDVLSDVRARDVGWSPTKGGACFEIDGVTQFCCRPMDRCCVVRGDQCVPCTLNEATGECVINETDAGSGDQ